MGYYQEYILLAPLNFLETKNLLKNLVIAPVKILTPNSYFTIFWSFLMLFCTAIDVLFTPLELSFYQFDRENPSISKTTLVLEILFLLDIIISFRTAYYERGVITLNNKAVIKHYLKGDFFSDAIPLLFDIIGVTLIHYWAWFLKAIKIIRMRKLKILFTRVEEYFNFDKSSTAVVKLGRLLLTLIVAAHWLACIFHLVANNEPNENTTWLINQGLKDLDILEKYSASLYWSVMTMMTVGYGDIHPVNSLERMVVIGAMVLACALFGYSLNTLGTAINEINEQKAVAREKIRNLRTYMDQKNLGKDIQARVKNYIEYMIESKRIHKHDEDQFMKLLSQNLKDEITIEVNGKILIECKLFSANFSHKCSMNLSKYMYEKFLSPEELVFDEGEEEDKSIYFISYGKIQIYNRSKVIKELTTSEYFGELAFFSGMPRQASAKSLLFSSLFCLNSETAQEYLRNFPPDFETFHMIRGDLTLYEKYDLLEIKCYSCNEQGHIARNCPKLHCVPPKQEIIKNYLEEQKTLHHTFLRSKRKRFHVLLNLFELQKCALEVMEDFFDEQASDDNLSQDSLDLMIERNLYLIPAAEHQDMVLRRAERRTRSVHQTQLLIFEDVNQVNKELDHDFSDADYEEDYKPEKINDLLFFSIDKVENFETFYPHNNVIKMIGDFEKRRLERLQQSEGGVMKALFLKTLMGGRKNLLIQVQRGRRNTKNLSKLPTMSGRLKNNMKKAISSKTDISSPKHQPSNLEQKFSGYNLNIVAPDSPTQLNESASEEDIATLSKTEARVMDRKNVNIKQIMTQIGTGFEARMPPNEPALYHPVIDSYRKSSPMPKREPTMTEYSGTKGMSPIHKFDGHELRKFETLTKKISGINSNINRLGSIELNSLFNRLPTNSAKEDDRPESVQLLEELIYKNMFEEETKMELKHNDKTKVVRSVSIDKMQNLRKNIEKYNIVDSVMHVMETRFPRHYTEIFGKNL